jgi:hypothetical protein
VPGDYDVQVSIHNGTARHGLEHLASTDRGIIMMRNMIRPTISANGAGEELDSPLLRDGKIIATIARTGWFVGSRQPRRTRPTPS